MPQLLEWAAAADHCQLSELCLRCLSVVPGSLARRPMGSLASALLDTTAAVRACDKRLLVLLVSVMAADLQLRSHHGSFEWALERFSQQPSAPGIFVSPPWFWVGGRRWRLKVFPGGWNAEAAGHLSGARKRGNPAA